MTDYKNLRISVREEDLESGIGIAIWQPVNETSLEKKGTQYCRFIGICNRSEDGMMVESPEPIDTEKPVIIKRYNLKEKKWDCYDCEIAWSSEEDKNSFHSGLRVKAEKSQTDRKNAEAESALSQVIENLEFFLKLPLLKYLQRSSFWALLNCLEPRNVKAGEKLITQGDEAESLFIIEKGHGEVSVTKNDEELVVAKLGPQDLVGEMAILTGEPRMANFTAREEMLVWELKRKQFEQAMTRSSDLQMFLTELISHRLETGSHCADRAIGKYIAKRKLGNGAWAIVYRGVHEVLNKVVAIKMLKHQMALDEEFSTRFVQEAEIIANMNHPNIVHVYDIESLYATHFIIMEYLEGESLEQLLKRVGHLSPEVTVPYLLQVCAGLAYAHEHGIVHQDIKPDNLLLQEDDTIKILDFGLACPTGSENFEMEGTIQYMSPEQIDSYPVDARTDIYCLGITAFEMLTGQRPYPDDDLQKMMVQRLNEDIISPAEIKEDLPERLCAFIMKACSREQDDRFLDVNEAITELELVAQEMGLHKDAVSSQHMSSLFLFYSEQQRAVLGKLLEEFSVRASESGISIQLADFKNVAMCNNFQTEDIKGI